MTTDFVWRKSSYSAENGECVEVAGTLGAARDSKHPDGPVLHADLTALVTALQAGRLAHSR